jgi:hypothetical protein
MTSLSQPDPPPPLNGDSTLGAVIAEFLRTTGAHGRSVRGAMSHIDAELGTMPVRSVRNRHVRAMLDGLRGAGLSSERDTAIVDALRSLFSFALARGLIAVNPIIEPALPPRDEADPRPAPAPLPRRRLQEPRTPTLAMLALGARVAAWTAWIIMLVFFVLLLALLVELA